MSAPEESHNSMPVGVGTSKSNRLNAEVMPFGTVH